MKITVETLRGWKGCRPFGALTAYDYPGARLLDEAGVPVLLVGDSLGMVVLGHSDTTSVTMEDIVHHLRAVARARGRALVGADLPYKAYETPAQAVFNARRLVEAGAEYVKAEGGQEILPQVQAILAEGIPFMGHLGMLPSMWWKRAVSTASKAAMRRAVSAFWKTPLLWKKPAPLPVSWSW